MRYLCWILAALLAAHVVYFYGRYKQAEQAPLSNDDRIPIELPPEQRDAVLAEMRGFLQSIQGMTGAAVRNDPQAMAEAARASGAEARKKVPSAVMEQLPAEFKKLGFDTHQRFDRIAQDVSQMGDTEPGMEQLPALLQNCVACHASYRLDVARGQ